jgi:putative copper resistance protein D
METELAAIRFAHYLSAMFVFGAGVYLLAFTPRALRAALSPGLRRSAIVAGIVAMLSALAWLAMESASMNDDFAAAFDLGSIREVLTSTSFGEVWQGRLLVSVATIVALVATRAENWGAPTLLGALLLASLALVDHGAMQSGGVGIAHRTNDALHLLATGGWLGGLLPFLLCLRAAGAGPKRDEANIAMLRFSAVGHLAVVLILLSGAINISLTTHALPWPPSSPYRALLDVKIGVVLVMILIAIVNRYALLPRVEAGAEDGLNLRRFVLLELGLALVAVALVSYFGLLDPA